MTLSQVGAMSEAEFRSWSQYAAKRMLPWRRMEFYLAQIAHTVALSSGRFDSPPKLRDFLFEHEQDEEVDLRELVGFNPRNVSGKSKSR